MRILRTPAERFAGLPGWNDEPRYVDVGGVLRVAYAESGPAGAPVVLLLHGEPTWAYLWRKVMAVLADAGHFLQEDRGEELGEAIVRFVRS